MEIILDNVKYNSPKYNESINEVSYVFDNGITFCSGLEGKVIKELLFKEKELESGQVLLSEKGYIYDLAFLTNNSDDFNESNIYNEIKYLNDYYQLNYEDINDRINNAIKVANIDKKMLKKEFSCMSNTELRLSKLVICLFINPKVIVLDFFEKNLSYKDKEYIKKLLLKLNKSYNKNIIIFSNDIECYMNILDRIVIFKNGQIVFNGDKSSLYDPTLYRYIERPSIVEFINYLNLHGHKFDNYIDIKELLKAIYRDVENK